LKYIQVNILLIFFFIYNFSYSQYNINIKVNKLSNSNLYLGYHYGLKTFIVDTIQINNNGKGIFKGNKKLHQGIYFIAFPSMNYFDFLINENQNFSIVTDTSNFLENLSFKNSNENKVFLEYQTIIGKLRIALTKQNAQLDKYRHIPDSVKQIQNSINKLSSSIKQYKAKIISENKAALFTKIINALSEPVIPKPDINKLKDYNLNKDSVLQMYFYSYYKDHYFDNFDFSDNRLLYSSILPSKINGFYSKIVNPLHDSLIFETKKLIEKASVNADMYKFTLIYLLSLFETSGKMSHDELFVYIAEAYYLSGKTKWMSKTLIEQLKLRVNSIKPNMIGKTAPNLLLQDDKELDFNINKLDDEYILLYFWDTECGHCKTYTPILHNISNKYKNKIKFIAVYTEKDKEKWLEYISDNKLNNWTNAYEKSGNSNLITLYDIYKTPRIYILNKNKTIIAKDIEIENIEKYLNSL
jgi:thiol-disulfide isomerase/thioredoxin